MKSCMWLGWASAVAAAVGIGACEQGVTAVNDVGDSGAGGGCRAVTFDGQLRNGQVSASDTSGGYDKCIQSLLDGDGHDWRSSCTNTSCDCLYDSKVVCSCEFGGETSCQQRTCCPDPWSTAI